MKKNNLLNWEVIEKPINLSDGTPIYNGKALVRSDNNEVLEVVNSNYVPFKNEELTKMIYQISETEKIKPSDINIIETQGGQRINARLKLDYKLSVRDDVIDSEIIIQNSHGGFSSLKFGLGNNVLSCSNGLVIFNKERSYNVFHNRNMVIELEEIIKNIETIKQDILYFNEFSNKIADKPIDDRNKIVLDAINYVTKVDLSISKEEFIKNFKPKTEEYILDFKWSSAQTMVKSIHHEMDTKGDNYWGLLNGFTYYNTHKSNASNRQAFLIDGYGKVISDRAIQFIRQQTSKN